MEVETGGSSKRAEVGVGMAIALGVVATCMFGTLGAFSWLRWVWSRAPASVRASVSPLKKNAVIALASLSIATLFFGILMTVVELYRAFYEVDREEPSMKARHLAEGISSAINWGVLGLMPLPLVVVVTFIAGSRLLRASQPNGS